MEDITVLGAGVAGLALIEKIREKNAACRITLIDRNDYHFCKKELISSPDSFNGRIELHKWSKSNQVEFIKAAVEKLSIRRRKIYFKQREAIGFDKLIIATGLISKKIASKGEHREGFLYLSQIDPSNLRDLLRSSSEITVSVSTLLGLKLSLAVNSLGKEVKIVNSSLDFLKRHKDRVITFLEKKNITLYLDSCIEEAIGEGKIKAVKISPLKVFSSQLVFIDSGFLPNCGFLEEETRPGDTFFTGHDEVYFLGDVSREGVASDFFFNFNQQGARLQGADLADYILERKTPCSERKTVEPEDEQRIIEDILTDANL